MRYTVNAPIVELIKELFDLGYTGNVTLTNSGASGTVAAFNNLPFMAAELSGFCKETLYLAFDTEKLEYVTVGRYNLFENDPQLSSADVIIDQAWRMYKSYIRKGYGRPPEWEEVFIKKGYMVKKTITKEVIEEIR